MGRDYDYKKTDAEAAAEKTREELCASGKEAGQDAKKAKKK